MEVGIYTFGDLGFASGSRQRKSTRQRIEEIIEMARIADQAGLDCFGIGEHHRLDFAVSSTPVVLAAIAAVTQRIRLLSTVTVLSTADPVRVFEEFATLDIISGGRAEIVAGRGAFIESFPLFGFDLRDYEKLYQEKLDLLLELRGNSVLNWSGSVRPPIRACEISPRPIQDELPIWVGTGGTLDSAYRAATLGLPLSLAIIGGKPAAFAPFAEAYRNAFKKAGRKTSNCRLSIGGHGFIAGDSGGARSTFLPHYRSYFRDNPRQRSNPRIVGDREYDAAVSEEGALYVGSPQEVVDKICSINEVMAVDRIMIQLDIGGVPFPSVISSIELLATAVAPVLRNLASRTTTNDHAL